MTGHPLAPLLDEVLVEASARRQGQVATYIPELSVVDPGRFGLAACTVGGALVGVGDSRVELTLQSLVKPFTYAAALERYGLETVHRRVGVEPTGDAFDSIIRVERSTHRPHNPMVNAGALAVIDLLAGEEAGLATADLLAGLGRWAGRPLPGIDLPVALSERISGHRNRAIAHLMRHFGMIRGPVLEVLELYFQLCAALVTVEDLAVMAGTLANGGVNPRTGERVLGAELVRAVLAVMATCGLYDAAGRFAFEVGLPAKSGVSGGIVAVAPGRMGLAAWAPPLDERGNSVRGGEAIRVVSDRLSLHFGRGGRERRLDCALADLEAARGAAARVPGGDRPPYLRNVEDHRGEPLGIAVCSVTGEEVTAGDADRPFSLQATVHPFAYALALADHGLDLVHERVGVEPSANPFHAIELDARTRRPFNPLANAGAIAVASLARGDAPGRIRRLADELSRWAATPLRVDAAVLHAERAAGDRNRAIASLLRGLGVVDDEEGALELYFQQCALSGTCRVLARLGAVLAAGGVDPSSGDRRLDATLVPRVVALMSTCGFHDESGRFAFEVGVPGKSGISGGIVAVVPGRMGLGIFAPGVSPQGNSVRGGAALACLARRLDLSVFAPPS